MVSPEIWLDAEDIDSRATTGTVARLSAFATEMLLDLIPQLRRTHFIQPYADANSDRIYAELSGLLNALMENVLTGTIVYYASYPVPDGLLICDGTEYEASDYPVLAKRLGAAYARPDNRFVVPDLIGRFVRSSYVVGDTGGEDMVTLSIAEIPPHQHAIEGYFSTVTTPGELPAVQIVVEPGLPTFTASAGLGQPHNNLPPYATLIPCIIA